MKIIQVGIKNIKGIADETYNFEIMPNKPNMLVAPNGFGKSSFAIAFNSMNSNRILLHKDHLHNGDDSLCPEVSIKVDDNGTITDLQATNASNNISKVFDISVINCQLKAKATKINRGAFTQATASMEVPPIVIVNKIPKKVEYGYSASSIKSEFGGNGKVLMNIVHMLDDFPLMDRLFHSPSFSKLNGKRVSTAIEAFIEEVNKQTGKADDIKKWIEEHQLGTLSDIMPLNELASIIRKRCKCTQVDAFLNAIQVMTLYNTTPAIFKEALTYSSYQHDKKFYKDLLSDFNTIRHKEQVKLKEDKKKGLIVQFPQAHKISNGQRDILTFIVQLQRARHKFKKDKCILIIDEIFDYLDDANLIAFQYYVTRFIDEFKRSNRKLYPILMTHLDPVCFKHFCFSGKKKRLKVSYLSRRDPQVDASMKLLIKNRDNVSIKDIVSKHHFHFHPKEYDAQHEFQALSIKKAWGKSHSFYEYLHDKASDYISGVDNYDPFAICLRLRIKIEEIIYQHLPSAEAQNGFLDTHGTGNKLDYAREVGCGVPESYYLLGLIYNNELHWHDQRDNESPLLSKLDNMVIRKIIKGILEKKIR